MNTDNEVTIYQTEQLATQSEGNYDVQVQTAKRFPREIKRSVDNMVAIATMDKQTAMSCGYSLPRGGKSISGGSVHMAKIIAQNWGNLRVEAKVSKITHTNIYSEAIAFDLETNVAVKVEATRKIINNQGQRFNEDLISLTGLVTNAIALRNAIFAVVPKSVVDKVYNSAMEVITGDLSDETKLVKKRKQVLDGFKETYGVEEKEILKALGLNTINQIKSEEIRILIGMGQSLKDGEFSVDNMFDRKQPKYNEEAPNPLSFEQEQQKQKPTRNEKKANNTKPDKLFQ